MYCGACGHPCDDFTFTDDGKPISSHLLCNDAPVFTTPPYTKADYDAAKHAGLDND